MHLSVTRKSYVVVGPEKSPQRPVQINASNITCKTDRFSVIDILQVSVYTKRNRVRSQMAHPLSWVLLIFHEFPFILRRIISIFLLKIGDLNF